MVTTTAGTITITMACDHPVPRRWQDEPRFIKVGWGEDGLQRWASFKTECCACRVMLGGYWTDPNPDFPWPPDPEMLRQDGAQLLVADG